MRIHAGFWGLHIFIANLDDAAGIDDEIRRIQNAAGATSSADFRTGQLVVGGTGNDTRLQTRQGIEVERGTEGARGIDIGRDIVDFIDMYHARLQFLLGARHRGGIDIGNDQLGTGLV